MHAELKNLLDIVLGTLQFLLTLAAAVWAYFRFSREGVHSPRIEFALRLRVLGVEGEHRAVEFVVSAANKGNIEHRFDRISLRVRGIGRGTELKLRDDGRLDFPQAIHKFELIPEDFGYYFVRPGVTQTFTFVTTLPRNVAYVLARSAFKYQDSDDLHTTESAFNIDADAPADVAATRETPY